MSEAPTKRRTTRLTELDVLIGRRIRNRRKNLSLSQEELGKMVGISFQQVQKYENAENCVLANRLPTLAEKLQVPITYFFDGALKNESAPIVENYVP